MTLFEMIVYHILAAFILSAAFVSFFEITNAEGALSRQINAEYQLFLSHINE